MIKSYKKGESRKKMRFGRKKVSFVRIDMYTGAVSIENKAVGKKEQKNTNLETKKIIICRCQQKG